MTNYRRIYVPYGTYFFTLNINNRASSLLTDNIQLLRHAFAKVKQKFSFDIDAVVVLPKHLHCVLTFPSSTNYSDIIRLIKTYFSKSLPKSELRSLSRQNKGERGVWQRRFWAHLIIDEDDYRKHIEYCYINPVKHGYVDKVYDWPFSSFHRDVKSGLFDKNWAGSVVDESFETIDFGER